MFGIEISRLRQIMPEPSSTGVIPRFGSFAESERALVANYGDVAVADDPYRPDVLELKHLFLRN